MACLDLEGRRCSWSAAAAWRTRRYAGCSTAGARVTVVAPEAQPELLALPVEWLERGYHSSDLRGRFLVVAATSSTPLNRRVFADAEARGVFCNVVDVPELCSLILPAVHRVGPIAVAVSTGGASPALAQRIRDEVAGLVGERHAELAEELRALRPWAKENLPTYETRRDFFRQRVEEALA